MRYRHRSLFARQARRLVVILTAIAAVAATGGGIASARPAHPSLSHRIHDVNAALHRLARQSAQLDEQYNVAAAAVVAARHTAARAKDAAVVATARYRAAHARFVSTTVQQYEAGPDPSVGELLVSASPQQYLDGAAQQQFLADRFAETAQAQESVRAAATQARSRAVAAFAVAQSKQAALTTQRAALRNQSRRFQHLLNSLTAQQRRALARARAIAAAKARATLFSGTATSGSAAMLKAVPGAVRRVIAFAEAQVGKSYVWGAGGPGAFDCSGLTMAAWAQAGVNLPHSAADQYNYGTHVGYGQLQPGDLIFLYSPISHVEIYVGPDLAVSAADPAIGIVYVHPSQDMADYAGATRLTG